MEESAAWGQGYDVGQAGLIHAVKSAEFIERLRICNLVIEYRDAWEKTPSFNYRAELTKLIERINNV